MKIGDIVCRKKYGKDICFRITDIKDGIYYLTGIEYRLIADSEESDLELSDFSSEKNDILVENKPCLKGSVLHIDGDKDYLKMCLKKYKEFNINVHGYYMKETEIKEKIIPLLEKHRPNLLVITGHDAMKKNGNRHDINCYLHSKDFVEAIRQARLYEDDKDSLIIFAGACQSYYELLLASGANFASSPSRKNIHALDPAIIASTISLTERNKEIDLKKLLEKTKYKEEGMGGIMCNGLMYVGYPR